MKRLAWLRLLGPAFVVSLDDWMTHMPPELIEEHLNISAAQLKAIPAAEYAVLPK